MSSSKVYLPSSSSCRDVSVAAALPVRRHAPARSLGGRLPSVLMAVVLTCAFALLQATAQSPAVRVWQDRLSLPTYLEGPANPNPPFDLFTFGRFNYPYPLRDVLTDKREPVSWRALHLENEYLHLTVLPDLGGHIYSCLDKRTGQHMFYANTAIKKALIGYRGAWAAFGVEFNFPVSHNWASMSPVDFATAQHPDGSASIFVGNTDQVYRGRWQVELRLQPSTTVVEQRVELYNASDLRHRYYWWTNGAVQAWENSRLVYPTELMATHGFTSIEPWPIDQRGRDLSVIRNQTDGPVSLFTYGTREGFVGVYHPHTKTGTVHLADPSELPVHKVWSWGNDRDAATWREALSDDNSAYVELQAGLFRNQETYAFLEPQESVRFTEYWLPVRDLGGITRATRDAVFHAERLTPTRVRLALDVTRDLPDAHVRVKAGEVDEIVQTLSPREVWRKEIDASSFSIELEDRLGNLLLRHKDGTFDRTPATAVQLGPQPGTRVMRSSSSSPAEIIESGTLDELEGRRLAALNAYREGLSRYPNSFPLLKAAGRLAIALGWAEAAGEREKGQGTRENSDPIAWLQSAAARNTTDFEVQYYLGLGLAAVGRASEARTHLESATRFRASAIQATLQLARLLARSGERDAALDRLRAVREESPRAVMLGILEVSLLRRLGRAAEARERAQHWAAVDPTSSLLRYESTLLGSSDTPLWLHLGADANRVLDLADYYLAFGAHDDALALLERSYPEIEAPLRENGAVLPRESPLVAYYRGYIRERLGRDARADFDAARRLPTTYVFPNRASSYDVLRAALRANPRDPTATFLLGSLYLASGLNDAAISAWQRARHDLPATPTLHRNLGLALLLGTPDYKEARAVFEEGLTTDPGNVEVYAVLDAVLSATNAPANDRVGALRRFATPESMPSILVFKLALALAEAGDATGAEKLFHDRFFPREEGGTNVRAVYAQTRLVSSRFAADARDCATALRILDDLPAERRDLPFTRGTLADALRPAPMTEQIALIETTCGRIAAAHQRWSQLERALAGASSAMDLAIADEARGQLGHQRTDEQKRRLEEALESTTATLDSGSATNPGSLEYARGRLLTALGRKDEARASLQHAFLFPDRNLSHAYVRVALAALRD
jgi:tetratricopeptide (TPR) repeat protein